MTQRLADKLARVRAMTKEVTDKIEKRADDFLARREKIEARTDKAFTPHEHILNAAEKELDAVEAELRQLANVPLGMKGPEKD